MGGRTRDRSLALGALLRQGDQKALKEILAAYRAARGNEVLAAEQLGIPRRTLIHWRQQVPALEAGVAEIRAAFPQYAGSKA